MDREISIDRLHASSQAREKINAFSYLELPIKCPIIISLTIFLSFVASTVTARQSIFYPNFEVCINYADREDIELALGAVQKTYDFFMSIGYSKKYPLWIFFQEKVEIETVTGELIRVYGKLNKDNQIYLTDWNEPWLTKQNPYGLQMNKDFYESLIPQKLHILLLKKSSAAKSKTPFPNISPTLFSYHGSTAHYAAGNFRPASPNGL